MQCLTLGIFGCADPYVNDATFALSMVFLEELGATGNKVCCCLLLLPSAYACVPWHACLVHVPPHICPLHATRSAAACSLLLYLHTCLMPSAPCHFSVFYISSKLGVRVWIQFLINHLV